MRLISALLCLTACAGCTTIKIQSDKFTATRTAWFIDTTADVDLTTPDGAKVTAHGLQSTVNTESLNNLISAVAAGAKP